MAYYLGIDIGGTKTAVILGNQDAQILERVSFATDHIGGPAKVMGDIADAMGEVRERRGLAAQDVQAVGISCGGPLDSRAGLVLGPPNLPGWNEVPVVAELSKAAERPVFLQNDANAGALAEWKFGAGRGTQNMIFITAGTGFGAGLILDGRLYSGTNDMAGEIGHVRLEKYGPFAYGKTGSVDGLCGGAGIAQVAKGMMDLAQRRGEQSILFMQGDDITARVIAEAAAEGDELAARVLLQAGEYWGRALAILVDLLNPERIVMGSLAVRMGERILGPAVETLRTEALSLSAGVCEVVPAELGDKLGDVAALCVAMQS